MKKLLSILGVVAFSTITSTSVIACGSEKTFINIQSVFADLKSGKTGMLVFDNEGNLYSSTVGTKIYKITKDGSESVFADLKSDKTFMLVFDNEGNLYSSTIDGTKIYKIVK